MEDAADLIERLFVVAAGILEDAHGVALTTATSLSQQERIAVLQSAASDLNALANATAVIASRIEG